MTPPSIHNAEPVPMSAEEHDDPLDPSTWPDSPRYDTTVTRVSVRLDAREPGRPIPARVHAFEHPPGVPAASLELGDIPYGETITISTTPQDLVATLVLALRDAVKATGSEIEPGYHDESLLLARALMAACGVEGMWLHEDGIR